MEECRSTKEYVEYEMKLRTTGFDIDPCELPKNIWSTNIDIWPEIAYADVHINVGTMTPAFELTW